MSASPRVLCSAIEAVWSPGSAMIMRWEQATLVDAPPGSLLEAAIGPANLRAYRTGDEMHAGLSN